MMVPPPWGKRGGGCKGISRQTVVPSTDASKQNTGEASFALILCQRDSCNENQVMSSNCGDLGYATTTASSLEN